jgi:hypothetical protein
MLASPISKKAHHLNAQINTVTTLMRPATSRQQFEELFERAFAREYQEKLPLIVEV